MARPRYDIPVHGRTALVTQCRIRRALASAAVTLAAMGTAGCASTQATLAGATATYESGQYQRALAEGAEVAARGPAADRPQAELLAGMAAYQLDRFDEAERHFLVAERTGSPAVRGRARVMLGNIRVEQDRLDAAAALFESGASDLSGADAEKARRFAALARSGQIGSQPEGTAGIARAPATVPAAAPSGSANPSAQATPSTPQRTGAAPAAGQGKPASEARAPVPKDAVARSPQPAQPSQSAGAPRPAQAARADESTFTVRAGAYTTESAARRRLKALEADVKRAKVPPARIDRIQTKDGDTLFAVRIGTFRTRADAETALKRLARKDLAVGAI